MKRKYLITAVLLVLVLSLCGRYTDAGAAGESPAGTFSFLIGNKEIKDGDTIDYLKKYRRYRERYQVRVGCEQQQYH